MSLAEELRIDDADGVYAALVEAHRGLDATASAALNARLVLLLCNEVGRADVIRAAIAHAVRAGREVRRL